MLQLKGVTQPDILKARITIYEAVIKTASAGSLQKAEVIPIAEKIWDKIIEPLLEDKK